MNNQSKPACSSATPNPKSAPTPTGPKRKAADISPHASPGSPGDFNAICSELYCMKCKEPTLMSQSSPSGGRNMLNRVCTPCGNFDKWLVRTSASPKKKGKKTKDTDADKAKREEARKTKADMAAMTEDERSQTYVDEKRKREAQEQGSKRTFTRMNGSTQHHDVTSIDKNILNQYITQDDWIEKQMNMKMYREAAQTKGFWFVKRSPEAPFGPHPFRYHTR